MKIGRFNKMTEKDCDGMQKVGSDFFIDEEKIIFEDEVIFYKKAGLEISISERLSILKFKRFLISERIKREKDLKKELENQKYGVFRVTDNENSLFLQDGFEKYINEARNNIDHYSELLKEIDKEIEDEQT